MKQTLNVISNLIYALLGVVIWIGEGLSPLPVALIALGVGSALFHAFFEHRSGAVRYFTHLSDEIGMYMVFSSILLMLYSAQGWDEHLFAWFIVAGVSFLASSTETLAVLGLWLFLRMIELGLIKEGIISVALFGLAYFLREQDKHDVEGHGWFHPVWHLLTGGMIGYICYLGLLK